jgi:hypothetical protein
MRESGLADTRCSCGFAETAGETITDHLLEAFVPENCLGSDALVLEEVRPDLTCSCGLVAATPGELDAHFLRVFTTGDLIGRDGRKHEVKPRKDLGFLPLTCCF